MPRGRLASWAVRAALCCLLGGVAGVRITKLDVPAVALEGDKVHLRCDYEDEGDSSLYTLKWYKDEQEFFRHQPGLAPREGDDRCRDHTYHVEGVSVDCWVSTERDVVLQGVSRSTSGDYQCEVIGEHPKFRKEAHKARLTVFSEPLQRPVVSGARESYTPQDNISLTCAPTNTEYLPLLSWRLNGGRVPSEYVVKYSDRSAIGLHFTARPDHFLRGVITVGCVTSFGTQHRKATEVTLPSTEYQSTRDYYYNAGVTTSCRAVATAAAMVVPVLFHRFF